MLSQLRRSLDRKQQIMYLSMMIQEVNDFFNVKGNMNIKQMALTAELILDNPGFYDLTLGNIKACFRRKMMEGRLYDRLDGNIVIGWLREFKSEMADRCETVREGEDRIREREEAAAGVGPITHAAYMAMLKARANNGDSEALSILAEYRRRSKTVTAEERRKKDLEFFQFRQQYIKNRKHGEKGK